MSARSPWIFFTETTVSLSEFHGRKTTLVFAGTKRENRARQRERGQKHREISVHTHHQDFLQFDDNRKIINRKQSNCDMTECERKQSQEICSKLLTKNSSHPSTTGPNGSNKTTKQSTSDCRSRKFLPSYSRT